MTSSIISFRDLLKRGFDRFYALVILPLKQFLHGLTPRERSVLYVLLAAAVLTGFVIGKLRGRRAHGTGRFRGFGAWRFPTFQNSGEALVSRALLAHFAPPDYHLMNHITLPMDDGTTQIDHILVSRFGIFVIETKDYSGWIFGNADDAKWTQVHFRQKFRFQNPIRQNYRHVRAVQDLLDCVPAEAVRSVVVFSGNAVFKTPMPAGVVEIDQLVTYLSQQTTAVTSLDRMRLCVGRIETARLAISRATDVEHMESLARRFRGVDRHET